MIGERDGAIDEREERMVRPRIRSKFKYSATLLFEEPCSFLLSWSERPETTLYTDERGPGRQRATKRIGQEGKKRGRAGN